MDYSKIYNWLFDHRHPIFLGGLITFFILPEVLEKIFLLNIPFQIFITILIVTSIMIIQTSPRKRMLSYALVLLLVIFIFIMNNYKTSYKGRSVIKTEDQVTRFLLEHFGGGWTEKQTINAAIEHSRINSGRIFKTKGGLTIELINDEKV